MTLGLSFNTIDFKVPHFRRGYCCCRNPGLPRLYIQCRRRFDVHVKVRMQTLGALVWFMSTSYEDVIIVNESKK